METRRDFIKKMVYLAPAIITLQATSAYAKNGSANCYTKQECIPVKPHITQKQT